MDELVQVEQVQRAAPPAEFLASTDVVDWYHPDVQTAAWFLASGQSDPVKVAKRCFEWVRDEIQHCMDFQRTEVTCRASEVLTHGTGFCYAKSHLLAALLRANRIPAGFCYQRLSIDDNGPPFCLHGFNAVWLPDHGWYRIDARGNRPRGDKPGIDCQFDPPRERLAFDPQLPGEAALREILAEPLPLVVDALCNSATLAAVLANLPDLLFCTAPARACIRSRQLGTSSSCAAPARGALRGRCRSPCSQRQYLGRC
jgi:transglutaminase-like putative cysteine protease